MPESLSTYKPRAPSSATVKPAIAITPGGSVSGVPAASSVVGPAGPLIAAGGLAELIAAIRAGVTCVNVDTTADCGGVPGGEVRGQIESPSSDRRPDHPRRPRAGSSFVRRRVAECGR